MTGLEVGTVRAWRPDAIDRCADAVDRCRASVVALDVELAARRCMGVTWTGPASEAAGQRYARVALALARVAGDLAFSAGCLRGAAEGVRAVKRLVARADERARREGAHVDTSGTLFLPVRAVDPDPVVRAHRERMDRLMADEVHAYHRQAVRVATEADALLASGLRAAAAAPPHITSTRPPGRDIVPPPPTTTDAGGVFESAAWWRCLGEAGRRQVLREHPEWVGPRDGVPAWARHEANLVLLARAERRAVEVRARTQQAGLGPFDLDAAARARARVADLQAVREVLGRRDGNVRQLLLLDTSERDVKAVVALGDVDAAEHVTTFVGGFTTTVRGDLARRDATFVRLRSDATLRSGGQRVAIVTWMGYDAPQVDEVATSLRRNVLSPSLARDSADELTAFVTGMSAARDAPVHQTVWAHSYGSVLAGFALLRSSSIDDVAVFGPPGVPFDRLEQTGLKPGGFNVLTAPADAVVSYGSLVHGHRAADVAGASRLATMTFRVAPDGAGPGPGSADPDRSARGHSDYLRPGTASADNLVAVAIARPDLLTRPVPAEEVAVASASEHGVAGGLGVPVGLLP